MSETRHPGMSLRHWWAEHVVEGVDHRAVVARVHEDAGWSAHFGFMTLMSAGIAVLGLLLSSPAVVIGAMLISPLMGPIIGLGFALATFDSAEMRCTVRALAAGVALAVGVSALLVLLSPLQTVTSEIAARTRPNLFDLLVALFSGLAGTYAMIRGRHGAIVGVAIATALMPPLAVMGFGLATANWTVLGGSSLLFFTNLMTIAAAAAVLARIYGFAPDLSPRQSRLQVTLVMATLLALAVPLGLSLRHIAWEAVSGRLIQEAIAQHFGPEARLGEIEIDYRHQPIEVAATVMTPRYRENAEPALRARLENLLARPVALSLDQIRTESGRAEEAQAAGGRGSALDRAASRMAERLALVAGVDPGRVLIDRAGRRAHVRAAPLPGADLASYRALESRAAAAESGWSVILVPPPAPLPDVRFEEGEPDQAALETAIWAARRLGFAVSVSGRSAEVERVVAALSEAEVRAVPGADGAGAGGAVALRWLPPES